MRASKATIMKRIETVVQIITLGGEFHDVREYAHKNQWQISDGQLRRYYDQALDLLEARMEKDRNKTRARHLAQRRALYARALKDGDLRTALAAAKDEAVLYGIYPPPPQPLKPLEVLLEQFPREFADRVREALGGALSTERTGQAASASPGEEVPGGPVPRPGGICPQGPENRTDPNYPGGPAQPDQATV
jgi:hypothetical protein